MNKAQEETWTKQNLMDVARSQKVIIWIIAYELIVLILAASVPSLIAVIIITCAVANIISIYFVYQLLVSLRFSAAWVYLILYFVFGMLPKTMAISFIFLLFINGKATKRLKENGIKVGLMGAKMADFANIPD